MEQRNLEILKTEFETDKNSIHLQIVNLTKDKVNFTLFINKLK